jgi:hypothetical protein
VIFFVHSTGILCWIGTKHEISVRKSRENPLEKNLSIVICFVVAQGDSLAIVGWLVKHYYRVQQ